MNVLSLFDGMSCGQIALNRAGIKYENYFASEIDSPAITVTQHNYPNTKQLGDVTKIKTAELPKIDLLIGGSPCQDISLLNKNSLGLDGEKSSLFYEYFRLKKELNPRYFLLENVSGNKEAIRIITDLMGVDPMVINSNIFVPQSRRRLYWTNIYIKDLPDKTDKKLVDILDTSDFEKYYIKDGRLKWLTGESGKKSITKRFTGIDRDIAGCLTRRSEKSWNCNYVTVDGRIRTLTPSEYEKLQGVPVGYTSCAKDSDRYEMLGNGWTVDVIAHIFRGILN
jgi:DNA-cytosine methyltransferase